MCSSCAVMQPAESNLASTVKGRQICINCHRIHTKLQPFDAGC